MRLHTALLALPLALMLAACGQNETPPAPSEQPAAETPAAAPAPAEPAAPAQSASLDLAPITGTWAATDCSTPIEITPTSFQGAENTCEISSFSGNGDGSMTAAMSCQSEGQTTDETIKMTPIFGPSGEGIRLEYVDRGGDPVTVFRCRP